MGWVKYSTIGAKAGTDLKDAAGNVLADAAVKNSAVTISAAGALSGAGGGTVAIGSLSGSSAYQNSQISISSAGALSGAGGGTVAIGSLSGSSGYNNQSITVNSTTGILENIGTGSIKVNNAKQLYTDITDTKPPTDANKVDIVAGTDGNISVNVNGAGAANIAAYSTAEKQKLNRLQAGKIPTSDSVLLENTTDSQTKATTAQTAATTAAASDATTKANAAQSAAESTASGDATTKANAAEAAAKAVEVANRFTVPANATDGVFSYKIGTGATTTYDVFSSTSRTKFSGIETGATAGATWGSNIGSQPSDANILNSGTFTGTIGTGGPSASNAATRLGKITNAGEFSGSLAAAQFPMFGLITAANATAVNTLTGGVTAGDMQWGTISVTAGAISESWSTEDQSSYLPNTTTETGTLSITHPTLGSFTSTYTWTRTGLNVSNFGVTTGSGNSAFTAASFGSAAATKTIVVTHTVSSATISMSAFVIDLSNLGGCLLPGSMIKHSNGETPIEEIEVGTKVIAYNETTGKEVEAEIFDKAPHKADFYYKVNDLQLTSGHPIWANDGWSCVDPVEYKRECIAYGHTLDLEPNKLGVGDVLYNGTLVEKIERVDEATEVWNIIIKDIHTYIANGILVHNGGGGGGGKCLTPAMLPEGLEVGDEVDSPVGKTKVVKIVEKQREGYYILEDELEITNDHPILIEGEWILAEEYQGKKEYIEGQTEVIYVETENELLTVKGWTVGGKY